jgi:hypothetical protein
MTDSGPTAVPGSDLTPSRRSVLKSLVLQLQQFQRFAGVVRRGHARDHQRRGQHGCARRELSGSGIV